MTRKRTMIGTLLMLAGGMSLAPIVEAASASAPAVKKIAPKAAEEKAKPASAASKRLLGTWPSNLPTVTLERPSMSVGEALSEIAGQAKWSLVATADLDQKLTLRFKDKPLLEALEAVLESADLEAELRAGMLIIKSTPSRRAKLSARVEINDDDHDAGDDVEVDDDIEPPEPPAPPMPPHLPSFKHRSRNDRIAFGGNLTIEESETVNDAVANGGNLTVKGHVRGSAVATGGSVVLKPGAVVDGDAIAVGGEVTVEPGAKLRGDRVGLAGSVGRLVKSLVKNEYLRDHVDDDDDDMPRHHIAGFFQKHIAGVLFRAMAAFVLGLLFITFLPERMGRIRAFMIEQPKSAALGGVAAFFGFIPMLVLLAVTIIGILLIPLAVVALLVVLLAGYLSLVMTVGERVPILQGRKTPIASLAIGVAVLTAVDIIPVAGALAIFFASFYAAGAVIMSRFGTPPKISESISESV